MSLAPDSNSASSAACCIDWPIAAARPLSGSSRAIRCLPEAVVGEPIGGPLGLGGATVVVGCGDSAQAPSSRATPARASRGRRNRGWRIGAILRLTNAMGR